MKYYNSINYSVDTLENAKAEYACVYKNTGKAFDEIYKEVSDNTIVTIYVPQNQEPRVMLMPNRFNKCSQEPGKRGLLDDNVAILSLCHASKRPNREVCFKNEKPTVIEGAFIVLGVKDDCIVSLTEEHVNKYMKMFKLLPIFIGYDSDRSITVNYNDKIEQEGKNIYVYDDNRKLKHTIAFKEEKYAQDYKDIIAAEKEKIHNELFMIYLEYSNVDYYK